ncbi:MAG: TlpA family protein disulfide reductase [Nitrospiraceae bacterium]|nr:MAG: TlpA family protein disulfide reductase [Nitrospiraceae bacterium]
MKKTLTVFYLFLFTFFMLLSDNYAQSLDRAIGESAPDFTIKDMSGKDVTLSSFNGRPVLLNFWATWCPYCRKERPYLKSLHEEYKNKDLVIIAVSIDRSSGTIENYMKQNPAPYIVLTDPEGIAAVPYNVMSLPTTYLIDRNGKIGRKFMGMVDWTDRNVKEYINNLIKQK